MAQKKCAREHRTRLLFLLLSGRRAAKYAGMKIAVFVDLHVVKRKNNHDSTADEHLPRHEEDVHLQSNHEKMERSWHKNGERVAK